MEDYKRDSTRGRCPRVDPVSYKPDTLVQTWVDARKLVMLDNWLNKNHIYTRYMADIVREVVDIVIDQLLEAKEVKKVEFSREAGDYLKAKFNKTTLNPGERGKRNIIHNLTLDERRKSRMMEESDRGLVNGISRPVSSDIQERNDRMWEEAQKKIRALEIQEAKDAIASRITFDENGVAVIPKSEGMYTAEERKREIAETRKRLGLKSSDQPNEVSVGPVKDKDYSDDDQDNDNPMKNATIAKLTEDELRRKEENIARRDRELEKQLSCLPEDLTPIDDE